MLVFAAFTPHTPLLIPEIGKDNLKKIAKTTAAMQELADDLYAAKPDTVVFISGHGTRYPDAFSITLSDSYRVDLSEFGELTHKEVFHPDMMLIDRLQRAFRHEHLPFSLHPEETLDHGTSVPLLLLSKQLPGVRVVPVIYSELDAKTHFKFGQELRELIEDSDHRVAVIASGDLSHCLTSDAPAGFNPEGAKFDAKIQELVTAGNAAGLIKLDAELIKNAAECGYRPLLILFGVLDKINMKPVIHSYEAPFGVGYLTASFELG
ncbi:MAG: AmmeMemoRadiSam system protein B [Candidatus Uhrbacteria bacterium]|nr:AmmeMemoRadiSam system protein B [Patescibacteria group bacterium]MBU1906727.1 AmmeMemoRadiSam system protein B [Patescibacteria group bacterium]